MKLNTESYKEAIRESKPYSPEMKMGDILEAKNRMQSERGWMFRLWHGILRTAIRK